MRTMVERARQHSEQLRGMAEEARERSEVVRRAEAAARLGRQQQAEIVREMQETLRAFPRPKRSGAAGRKRPRRRPHPRRKSPRSS
jgi:hypothetical protein